MTVAEAERLIRENPADLHIGENVRLDPRLDRPFVESIKERGVLEPVVAYIDDDSQQLVVLFGKRRVLAARQTKLKTVPVMVVPRPGDADRLVNQLVENEHRAALADAERAGAFEQMTLAGMSAYQIAKRTVTKRATVDAALKVAGSEVATKAVREVEWLTLDRAAALTEFADDQAVVDELLSATNGGTFDHRAQRARDARQWARVMDEARETAAADGLTIVTRPNYNDPKCQPLYVLTRGAEPLDEDGHRDCPGHAAYLEQGYGARDAFTVTRVFVCVDYPGNGHAHRHATAGKATAPTEEQKAAASAERRDVIASNKAWESARIVRGTWLREFAARRKAPDGTAAYLGTCVARSDPALAEEGGRHLLAHELLGLNPTDTGDYQTREQRGEVLQDALAKASEDRALMIALVVMLAAQEEATSRDAWRHVRPAITRYLRFLESAGYTLSDVELRACGATPEPAGEATHA